MIIVAALSNGNKMPRCDLFTCHSSLVDTMVLTVTCWQWHVDSNLYWSNRALLCRRDALLHCTHISRQSRLISYGWRDTTQQRWHLTHTQIHYQYIGCSDAMWRQSVTSVNESDRDSNSQLKSQLNAHFNSICADILSSDRIDGWHDVSFLCWKCS